MLSRLSEKQRHPPYPLCAGKWGRSVYDAEGNRIETLTRDPDGSLARRQAQAFDPLGSETPTYLHTDHLATPRLGTDQAGIPVWRWESPAFGDAPPSLQLRTVNLRFPGQYFDAETGLHQNWHREYDPRIGRYVQSDPVGLMGGSNSYAYVEADPVTYTDETGALPWIAAAVWAAQAAWGAYQGYQASEASMRLSAITPHWIQA